MLCYSQEFCIEFTYAEWLVYTAKESSQEGRGGRSCLEGFLCSCFIGSRLGTSGLLYEAKGKEGPKCHSEAGVPSSSKSLRFAARPGFGQSGIRVIIKANHFFASYQGMINSTMML